jgi:hypothetical protein
MPSPQARLVSPATLDGRDRGTERSRPHSTLRREPRSDRCRAPSREREGAYEVSDRRAGGRRIVGRPGVRERRTDPSPASTGAQALSSRRHGCDRCSPRSPPPRYAVLVRADGGGVDHHDIGGVFVRQIARNLVLDAGCTPPHEGVGKASSAAAGRLTAPQPSDRAGRVRPPRAAEAAKSPPVSPLRRDVRTRPTMAAGLDARADARSMIRDRRGGARTPFAGSRRQRAAPRARRGCATADGAAGRLRR